MFSVTVVKIKGRVLSNVYFIDRINLMGGTRQEIKALCSATLENRVQV